MRKASYASALTPSIRKLEVQYEDKGDALYPKGFVYIAIIEKGVILRNIIIEPDDFARIIQEQLGSTDDV